MKLKIAKSVAAILVAQISIMAETQLDDITINTSAFDAQVKSVSSKQLEEEQASDVKDILKSLPSVTVDGNARYGQKVYVRGLEDKFANITVDGAKLGGQLFHHSGDQTIDASLLKITSVELGPNSALSGQGVINGSFVYETKDPSDFLAEDENFGGKITLGYQTGYERKSGTVAVFGKVNDKLEFVGIGTISSDGTLHLGNGEKVKSKDSKLESGLAKIVIKPNDYNTFKLSYNRYEDGGNRQLSGEKVGTEDADNDYNSITRDTFTLNYEYAPDNELVNVKANAYYNKQYLTREATDGTDSTSGLTYTEPQRKYINSTRGFDLRNSSLFGIHKITFGTDYTHEDQEVDASGLRVYSDSSTVDLNFKGGEIDSQGLYLEDEMAFDRLVFTLGARYDYYKLGGIYDGTFTQLSPKVKLKYQASENLTLRSGYGHIFKGPALGETLAVDSTDVQSNDTNAQIGNNFEVGLDYDLTKALNADDAIIGFNAYRYNVDNYAHTTKNNSLSSQSDIMIWGLETMFSYKKDKLGLNISHTFTDGKQKDLATGINYDPKTTNIHVFKVGANYQVTNEFKVNYNSQFVPGNEWLNYSSRDGSTTKYKRSGYAVHDINLTYNPSKYKNTSFNFGVGNILDKKYVTHTGFGVQTVSTNKSYEVGRNFKFQMSYKF
jgi:hemoglobin/transferrin/lactoferrin receptor protein